MLQYIQSSVKIITVGHQTFDWPNLVYTWSFQYMLGQLCLDESMDSVERSAKPLQKKKLGVLYHWQPLAGSNANLIRNTKALCGWSERKTAPQAVLLPCSARFVVNTRSGYSLYWITHLFGSKDRPTWGAAPWLTIQKTSSTEQPWSGCVVSVTRTILPHW